MEPADEPRGLSRAAYIVATVAGLGDLLPAPGTTAGSLPTAIVWGAGAVAVADGRQIAVATVVALVVVLVAGLWAAQAEAERRGKGDPGAVVVDEVGGQLLAYLVAIPWTPVTTLEGAVATAGVGFFAFRFFDVLKPPPVRQLERFHGGIGIMVDDLAAGVYAGIVLALLAPFLG